MKLLTFPLLLYFLAGCGLAIHQLANYPEEIVEPASEDIVEYIGNQYEVALHRFSFEGQTSIDQNVEKMLRAIGYEVGESGMAVDIKVFTEKGNPEVYVTLKIENRRITQAYAPLLSGEYGKSEETVTVGEYHE